MSDLIERWAVIELLSDRRCNTNCFDESGQKIYEELSKAIENVKDLPSVQPTLCGYDIEHLMLIAAVLRKENFPPERVAEILTDIGRIVSIVRDEFEESLRKALEQYMAELCKGEQE